MARPRPIVIPGQGGLSLSRTNKGAIGEPIGQLLGMFLAGQLKKGREAKAQEQFLEQAQPIFAQPVPAAGPVTEAGVAPQAEVVPERTQSILNLLAQTAPSRQAFRGAQIKALLPEVGKERRIIKGPAGRQRFVDTGELVFPKVTAPTEEPESIFGKVTDITKFTNESLKKAESSGLRSDLELSPEFLRKTATGKSKFDAEKDLRKEFVSMSKTFREVRDSFARVEESGREPSAAGDLSLIFNFMKILDPGSVVRESEFANAQTAQPLLERLGISFDAVGRIWEGKKLSAIAREDFVDRANKLFSRQSKQHEKRVGLFEGIVDRNKLDRRNVVLDLTDPRFEVEGVEEEIEDLSQVNISDLTDEQLDAELARLKGGQ